MQLNIHTIPPQVDIPSSISSFLDHQLPRLLKVTEDLTVQTSDLIEELPYSNFNCLPDEAIVKIFGYLDLLSLCKCSQVNRQFHRLAADSLLYTELNLKVILRTSQRQSTLRLP
ncbi:unnamed protein product [Timema podura]|uniref:F-box domain-containing protein n=1 Tax=Timema podura TaxID=61482 RepID=A0ABN7PAU4_TIMPD|nr:unnamed protein product [Timema podura]